MAPTYEDLEAEIRGLQDALTELHGFVVTELDRDPAPIGEYFSTLAARALATNAHNHSTRRAATPPPRQERVASQYTGRPAA